MKRKIIKKFLIVFLFQIFLLNLLVFTNITISNAKDTETENSQDEILQSQKDSLNISSFINETKKYTQDTFEDLNMNELFSSAITGNIDNETIFKTIANMVGKEVVDCITVLGSIVVIIVIHSILKSVSEGLENKAISQITYYVQYILIVTLIMTNFADILSMVRTSIDNLVGFMNSLVPLLITLMLTTRKYSISRNNRANYFIYNNLYWKFYQCSINSVCINCKCIRNCIKNIQQSSNR